MLRGCRARTLPSCRTALPHRGRHTCQVCYAAEKRYAFGDGDPAMRGVRMSQGQSPLPQTTRAELNSSPVLLGTQPILSVRTSWAPRQPAGTGSTSHPSTRSCLLGRRSQKTTPETVGSPSEGGAGICRLLLGAQGWSRQLWRGVVLVSLCAQPSVSCPESRSWGQHARQPGLGHLIGTARKMKKHKKDM